MSTNYYIRRNKPADLTEFCKSFNNDWDSFVTKVYEIQNDELHIGKSSAGWRFLFQSHEEYKNFNEFESFIKTIGKEGKYKDYYIVDEYDNRISAKELLKIINNKQSEPFRNPDGSPTDVEPVNYMTTIIDGYRFSSNDFS